MCWSWDTRSYGSRKIYVTTRTSQPHWILSSLAVRCDLPHAIIFQADRFGPQIEDILNSGRWWNLWKVQIKHVGMAPISKGFILEHWHHLILQSKTDQTTGTILWNQFCVFISRRTIEVLHLRGFKVGVLLSTTQQEAFPIQVEYGVQQLIRCPGPKSHVSQNFSSSIATNRVLTLVLSPKPGRYTGI